MIEQHDNENGKLKVRARTLGASLLAVASFACSVPEQPGRVPVNENASIVNLSSIDFTQYSFQAIIDLPADYEVYDFTQGYDENRERSSEYGIGRFNEKRPGMYVTDLFGGVRDIHMGIDIGAPVGTPVHAFFDGEVLSFGYNPAEGDYGNVVVTKHEIDGVALYALYGHLSHSSIEGMSVGQQLPAGGIVGYLGDRHENGGWNAHVHFQLSLERPETHDMPGAVSDANREEALQKFLDPRLVLGPLY